MLMLVAVLLQTPAGGARTCDVDPNGNYCQSIEANYEAPCAGVLRDAPAKVPDLLARERRQSIALRQARESSAEWFALACTRVAVLRWVPDPRFALLLMRRHPSWYESAIMAALEGARLASDSARASLLLLSAMLMRAAPGRPDPDRVNVPLVATLAGRPPQDRMSTYARQATALLADAVTRRSTDTRVLRACTALALDAGDYAVAHECAFRSIVIGREPSWNLLRLSWLAVHRADSSGAAVLFQKAVDTAREKVARSDLGWHFKTGIDLQAVWGFAGPSKASPALIKERLDWLALPQTQLLSWIAERAQSSDAWVPLDDRKALAEHFTHLAFAGELFRDGVDGEKDPPCGGHEHQDLKAKRLRFWDANGTPIVVVPYRASGTGASSAARTSGFTLGLRQWDATGHETLDSLSVNPAPSAHGALAEGIIVARSVPGLDSWTLDLKSRGTRRLGDFQDFQPPLDEGVLTVSDLAAGSPDNGVRWHHGELDTQIATSDSFDRRQPIELYFQIRCDSDCRVTQRSIVLYPLRNRGSIGPRIMVTTEGRTAFGLTHVATQLDVSRLPPGGYRLEVEVRTEAGSRAVRRSMNLMLR